MCLTPWKCPHPRATLPRATSSASGSRVGSMVATRLRLDCLRLAAMDAASSSAASASTSTSRFATCPKHHDRGHRHVEFYLKSRNLELTSRRVPPPRAGAWIGAGAESLCIAHSSHSLRHANSSLSVSPVRSCQRIVGRGGQHGTRNFHMGRARCQCAHAHTHTHTRTHAHTRTRAHAHTRTRAHAHTRARAHIDINPRRLRHRSALGCWEREARGV